MLENIRSKYVFFQLFPFVYCQFNFSFFLPRVSLSGTLIYTSRYQLPCLGTVIIFLPPVSLSGTLINTSRYQLPCLGTSYHFSTPSFIRWHNNHVTSCQNPSPMQVKHIYRRHCRFATHSSLRITRYLNQNPAP